MSKTVVGTEDLLEEASMSDVAVLAAKLEAVHTDLSDVKVAIRELNVTMGAAMNQVSLSQERQNQMSASLGRAFDVVEKLEMRIREIEARVMDLERNSSEFKRTNIWVDRAVWATAAAGATFVIKQIGIL